MALATLDEKKLTSAPGVTQVVLVGVAASIGVESTVRAAHEHGYHVVPATDAMTEPDPGAHADSIQRIFPGTRRDRHHQGDRRPAGDDAMTLPGTPLKNRRVGEIHSPLPCTAPGAHGTAPLVASPGRRSRGGAGVVLEDFYPVQWDGGQAVVALPEHIGASNAGQVRDALLSVINLGAVTLIADMTATVSCDHAGADAVVRAWQRTVSSGTELRLVVTAGSVSRVLSMRGLDRQVSVYPSLDAAVAARLPAAAAVLAASAPRRDGPPPDGDRAAPVPAGRLLEALQDAVVLADGDGTIAAASGRLEDMFGYGPGELAGLPVESLVPECLQEAHQDHRAAWGRSPSARPMGASAQLAGLRKDGTRFPVRVSLIPVIAGSRQLTLAVIRDVTGTGRLDDLAALVRGAAAAQRAHLRLLDAVVTGLFRTGLSLQAAAGLPADAAGQRAGEVAGELDDIIRQIRAAAFAEPDSPGPAPPRAPGDDW
jgi:anti-anti-sigma factor